MQTPRGEAVAVPGTSPRWMQDAKPGPRANQQVAQMSDGIDGHAWSSVKHEDNQTFQVAVEKPPAIL
jgi:hypothetical protein